MSTIVRLLFSVHNCLEDMPVLTSTQENLYTKLIEVGQLWCDHWEIAY